MLNEYFNNNYKWNDNEDSCFQYQHYKGFKKNLNELEFISKIIFPDMEFKDGKPIQNNDKKLIGAYIIGNERINSNINGLHQGDGDYIVYLFLGLCENGFFMHQTSSEQNMINYINELKFNSKRGIL